MRKAIFLIFIIILIGQIYWYFYFILPPSTKEISLPVKMILNGEIPLREVYQKKENLKEIYKALGDETPIGIQFETLIRRFNPKSKGANKKNAPAFYTLNDWALGMLEFIPFKDMPNVDVDWKKEVLEFMYQGNSRAIYGLENMSLEKNEVLVLKWKSLLGKYLNE